MTNERGSKALLPNVELSMYKLMQATKKKINSNKDNAALLYMAEAIKAKEPTAVEDPGFWLNNLDSTLKALRDHGDEETLITMIEDLQGYLEC